MSILIDKNTRVICQGFTGKTEVARGGLSINTVTHKLCVLTEAFGHEEHHTRHR